MKESLLVDVSSRPLKKRGGSMIFIDVVHKKCIDFFAYYLRYKLILDHYSLHDL